MNFNCFLKSVTTQTNNYQPNVCASDSQVTATLVKAQTLHLHIKRHQHIVAHQMLQKPNNIRVTPHPSYGEHSPRSDHPAEWS